MTPLPLSPIFMMNRISEMMRAQEILNPTAPHKIYVDPHLWDAITRKTDFTVEIPDNMTRLLGLPVVINKFFAPGGFAVFSRDGQPLFTGTVNLENMEGPKNGQ